MPSRVSWARAPSVCTARFVSTIPIIWKYWSNDKPSARRGPPHRRRDRIRRGFDDLPWFAFHHHPQQRLGAGGPKQYPAATAQRLLRLGARGGDPPILLPVKLPRHLHVHEDLRKHDQIGGEFRQRLLRVAKRR